MRCASACRSSTVTLTPAPEASTAAGCPAAGCAASANTGVHSAKLRKPWRRVCRDKGNCIVISIFPKKQKKAGFPPLLYMSPKDRALNYKLLVDVRPRHTVVADHALAGAGVCALLEGSTQDGHALCKLHIAPAVGVRSSSSLLRHSSAGHRCCTESHNAHFTANSQLGGRARREHCAVLLASFFAVEEHLRAGGSADLAVGIHRRVCSLFREQEDLERSNRIDNGLVEHAVSLGCVSNVGVKRTNSTRTVSQQCRSCGADCGHAVRRANSGRVVGSNHVATGRHREDPIEIGRASCRERV